MHHTIDDVRALFSFEKMASIDQRIFSADVNNLFRVWECRGDTIPTETFDEIVTTLSHWGWYQRGRDTLTRAGGGKADSVSHGEGRLLLDTPAAAEAMGLTLSQFTKLVSKRRIPFVPVTGVVNGDGRYQHKRFRREDLDRWAANNVVEARS